MIAVHVRRPPADLTRRQAGLLLDGGITRWSQLGLPGGRLTVTRKPSALRVARARHGRGGARQQGRARGAGAVGGGRAPAARPRRLPDPGGRSRARPGHHADRGRRHHARPAGRRAGRGGGRPVVPAPADAAPPPLRRHHRRQPREHALDRRLRPPRAATRSPPTRGWRHGLRAAGFDALSLANNHAGDYGEHGAGADRRPARRRRPAPVRRGPRPGRRASAGGRRAARRPLRLRRLQRHRRDPRGRSGPAGCELGQHADPHRAARPGRARPRARATCDDSPAASTW